MESFRLESIADAAIAVIARKGLASTTIQDIAEAAGIAKGTVYLYFRDRDELVAKAAGRAYETLIQNLDMTFSSSGTLNERLMRVVMHPLEFIEEHSELLLAALALADRDDRPYESHSPLHAQYATRLEEMFHEARRRGEIRDVDCPALAAMVLACVRGMVVRRLKQASPPARPPARETEAAFIVSVLLRGIQTTCAK